MFIPDSFKSKRQIIIETYLTTDSIPETARRLKIVYEYARKTVRAYQKEMIHLERTAIGVKSDAGNE